MARPERLELPTYWFEASRSIQLSYGRLTLVYHVTLAAMGIEQALERLAREAKAGPKSPKTIARWNRELLGLRLGVEVYLTIRPFYGGAWVLGYGNVARAGWCLAVRPPAEGTEPVPLLEAPRSVQMAAMTLVPELLDELNRHVNVTLRGIQWARVIPESLPRLAGERRTRKGQ